jgi:2'-5' RNA ligase
VSSPATEPGPERARLFVALDLPAPARHAVAAWAREVLGDDESLRLVAPEALHVTLAFLGWRAVAEVEDVVDVTANAVARHAAPVLEPLTLAGLPARRPRVLAIDLADRGARLGELQASVGAALARAGLYAPESRPFRPHLTVARVRRNGRAPAGRFPDPPAAPIHAAEVVVYRSDLRPSGALYTALARFGLDPDPA